MISVVINADTRYGYNNNRTKVGEFTKDALNGTRSIDFLTEGVKNKMNFFRGYDTQCILYIDKHEEIEGGVFKEIMEMVEGYGNCSKIIFKEHNRTRHRWYDYITLEALKLADGDYIVHFDNDSNAFRSDDSDVIEKYFKWLGSGYKYICTSVSPLHIKQWYWASTQFFICEKETINIAETEKCLDNKYLEQQYGRIRYDPYPCCVEHTIGLMVKDGEVFYPQHEIDSYMIFCWWEYERGLLKKLNDMPYNKAKDFILKCGLTQSSW